MLKNVFKTRVTLDTTPSTFQTENRTPLWDNLQMFRNKETPKKCRIVVNRDPLENECPLLQPNQFIFNEQLKSSFRDYLDGMKSALNLVNECNHLTSKARKKDKLKLFSNVHKFRSQLKQRSSVRLSLIQHSQADDIIERKLKVAERFEKIKKLIQERMTNKHKDSSLKDGLLFKNLFDTCEKNVNKIKSKNLLSKKADGIREFDHTQYSKNIHGALRVRISESKSVPKIKNVSDVETMHVARKKARQKMDDKLTEFVKNERNQENLYMKQAKKNLLREQKLNQVNKNTNIQFHSYDSNHFNKTDPLNRDVKFYAYMFMKPNYSTENNQENNEKCHTNTQTSKEISKQRHYLTNFHQTIDSRDDSLENDSSFKSIQEVNIDNLYKRSIDLQNYILNNKSEKFVRRIKQFQRVEQLTNEIIRVNKQKLQNEKIQ